MPMTAQTLATLTELAALEGDEAQRVKWQQQLDDMLQAVAPLLAVDTAGIEPMVHPRDGSQRLRADEVTEADQRDRLLALAPQTDQGLFLVPQVIE